jgi:hypothetical protein
MSENLTFVPSILVQSPIPLKDPKSKVFTRNSGGMQVEYLSGAGVPFGHHGRLVVSLVVTDAIRNKSPKVDLQTISNWIRRMNVGVTGGERGTTFSVRDQFHRLSSLFLSASRKIEKNGAIFHQQVNLPIAEELELWWDAKDKSAQLPALFDSYVLLSNKFYDYIQNHSVPVDLKVYNKFQAPRAQDIYAWLAWKFNALDKPAEITWSQLELQFSDSKQVNQRRWKKDWLTDAFEVITEGYPGASVKASESGIILSPSPRSVQPRESGFIT